MTDKISVGIGEYCVSKDPGKTLVAHGLGSCIGLSAYDERLQVAGLIHIMLPSVTSSNNIANKAKFADTGIPFLLEEMKKVGARPRHLKIKIAGGARMFKVNTESSIFDIGERNVEAVKKTLATLGFKVYSEDTGLNYGRTMEFYVNNGQVIVRTFGQGQKEL